MTLAIALHGLRGGSPRAGRGVDRGGQAQAALAPLPAAAGKCASVAGPFGAGQYREGRAEKKQCARENISGPD